MVIHRSILYSEFIWIATLGGSLSLWSVPILQALITAAMFRVLVQELLGQSYDSIRFLTVMVALSVFSTVSWHVSSIMPDFIEPLLAISLYLLIFKYRAISRSKAIFAFALIIFGFGLHFSFVPVVIIAAAFLLLVSFSELHHNKMASFLRISLALGSAGLLLQVSNSILNQPIKSVGKFNYLLGRMAQSGSLYQVLVKTCPNNPSPLCPFVEKIRTIEVNDFMWGEWNPMFNGVSADWNSSAEESKRLIFENLKQFPWLNLKDALEVTFQQLLSLHLVQRIIQITPDNSAFWLLPVEAAAPQDIVMATRAIYREAKLFKAMDFLDNFQVGAAYICSIALITLFSFVSTQFRQLALTVIVFLLANAAVCGIFSGPSPRYQARIMCLPIFWVMLMAVKYFTDAKHIIRKFRQFGQINKTFMR